MTRKFDAWAKATTAPPSTRCTPSYETVLGHQVYKSIFDIPGDLDLAIILTGKAVDTFEEVLARKAKFAVIFAAGFSETGKEGEKLEQRLTDLVAERRRAPPRARTRTSTRSSSSATTSTARRSRSSPSRATRAGRCSRARSSASASPTGRPTGNEVDLEFADFCRYFADQDEVGVVACYIEGFKDGRTLMLAADHAAKLQKPIVMVKVGRTETGSSMAQSHTGHLTGSDAITDAVFRQLGVTRVDGLDELLEVSRLRRTLLPDLRRPNEGASAGPAAAQRLPAWAKKKAEPGVCVYAISGGTGAHMADMLAAADLRLPPLAKETQQTPARRADPRVPAGEQPGRLRRAAGRRLARPQDPRRDRRRPEDRHHRGADHRRGRRVQRAVHPRPHRRRRRPPTSRSSSCGARPRAPTTRTTSACSTAGSPCSARSATA